MTKLQKAIGIIFSLIGIGGAISLIITIIFYKEFNRLGMYLMIGSIIVLCFLDMLFNINKKPKLR
jgi:predicted membrane channel-forming protein YqfA (hemolysin III family)